ncbi:MAG: hypothetical protein H6923_05810 [Alphaproteobacteria bacterium]|nr:hypothetical protein [Alphaproteobacteria bacterium]
MIRHYLPVLVALAPVVLYGLFVWLRGDRPEAPHARRVGLLAGILGLVAAIALVAWAGLSMAELPPGLLPAGKGGAP